MATAAKRLSISKVDGKKNLADILTKAVDSVTLARMLKGMHMIISQRRSSVIPETQKEKG